MDRGDRIIGSALLQGKLSWTLAVEALLRQAKVPTEGDAAVRLLLEEGILSPSDVVGLESTEGGYRSGDDAVRTQAPPRAEPSAGEASHAKLLTALAIPQWRQYRNLRFVGEGGMGRIYKGFDSILRRMVALKFLRRMETQLVARFMQEAQLQGGLEHPNICRVYEVGDWQGQAYIAMQFIKGETLDVCAASLSLVEKVQVMETAATAVHFAHRQGLIHRDLKPANIMVERPEGQSPQPFLLDFGLARGLAPSGFTVDGQIVGTYHFMAPEQARGDMQALDRRTDVYALGATLYAVLADKPPFWEVEGVEVLRRTLHDEPVPIGHVVPGLPQDLDTIVMKCLEKDPAQRYESARALAEDLRRFLDDEPILARRPTLRYRASKFARKNKTLVGISAAALVAVLTFGALAAGSWATARTRARHAQAFGQEAERLEAMARYIHLLPAHDIRAEREAIRQRMRDLGVQAASRGRFAKGPAAYALGRGHMALGEVEEAHQRFLEAQGLGFDGPEVRFALGRAQGALFQKAMDAARRIGDAALRKAEEGRARKEWLEPALAHLKAGAGTALHGAAFEQALLDFYGQRYDQALAKAREAFHGTPWFYEAKRLEADILHAQAMEAREASKALAMLGGVAEQLQVARRIAPSDPALPLAVARVWRDAQLKRAFAGMPGTEALEACGGAVEEALRLDPRLAEAPAALAHAYNYAAMGKAFRREPNRAEIDAGLARAEAALELDPQHFEALRAQISLLGRTFFAAFDAKVRDEDTGPILDRLRHLAARAFALRPGSPEVTAAYGGVLRFWFTRLSLRGLAPWEAFEEALALLRGALQAHPDYPSLHQALGSLWVERAEHERLLGQLPEASVEQAQRAYGACLALVPGNFLARCGRGTASLVLADAQVGLGQDPSQALEVAERGSQEALALNPTSLDALTTLAEAAFLRAEWRQSAGGEMGSALAEVRTHLAALPPQASNEVGALQFRLCLLEGRPPESSLLKDMEHRAAQRPLKYLGLLGRHHLQLWERTRSGASRRAAQACLLRLEALAPAHPDAARLRRGLKQ